VYDEQVCLNTQVFIWRWVLTLWSIRNFSSHATIDCLRYPVIKIAQSCLDVVLVSSTQHLRGYHVVRWDSPTWVTLDQSMSMKVFTQIEARSKIKFQKHTTIFMWWGNNLFWPSIIPFNYFTSVATKYTAPMWLVLCRPTMSAQLYGEKVCRPTMSAQLYGEKVVTFTTYVYNSQLQCFDPQMDCQNQYVYLGFSW